MGYGAEGGQRERGGLGPPHILLLACEISQPLKNLHKKSCPHSGMSIQWNPGWGYGTLSITQDRVLPIELQQMGCDQKHGYKNQEKLTPPSSIVFIALARHTEMCGVLFFLDSLRAELAGGVQCTSNNKTL